MQQTTNYNLLIPEGTDVVNPLTQVNPNFQTIDSAMFANKQATIGTASEVVTGTVHAIVRNNPDSDIFRFTATGAWTAGDSMTVDGVGVTVHLSDGTAPVTGSYVIGAEVLAMINGTLVTLAISAKPASDGVTSFNSRTGVVVPTASDYDASMVDYDNTVSGLTSTDVQAAIDEIVASMPSGGGADYSTTEHVVGTWINGATLYEITIDCGMLPNNTTNIINHGVANISYIVHIEGAAISNDGGGLNVIPLPCAPSTANPLNAVYVDANDTRIRIGSGSDRSTYHGYVTLRYVKTT